MRFRVFTPLACALAIGACGGTAEDSEPPSPPTGGSAPDTEDDRGRGGGGTLPAVTVDDLDGGKVGLSSLAPEGKPLLVWFWAPH